MKPLPAVHLLVPLDHGWKHHCGLALADVPDGHSIPLEFYVQYHARLCSECAQWPDPPVLSTRTTPGPQPSIKARTKDRQRTAGTEKAFMARVIAEAQRAGYLVYHTFNSQRSQKGYPDLCLAKPGYPLLLWELKSEKGTLTIEQAKWLEVLSLATGVETHVLRPQDWDAIVQKLHQNEGHK